MKKSEILQQVDGQLWGGPEISYTQAGQWFWYDLKAKDPKSSLFIIWGGKESFKPGTELKRQSYCSVKIK